MRKPFVEEVKGRALNNVYCLFTANPVPIDYTVSAYADCRGQVLYEMLAATTTARVSSR